MNKYKIPRYYTDDTLTEEEKVQLDWEMIAKDFPIPATSKDELRMEI